MRIAEIFASLGNRGGGTRLGRRI